MTFRISQRPQCMVEHLVNMDGHIAESYFPDHFSAVLNSRWQLGQHMFFEELPNGSGRPCIWTLRTCSEPIIAAKLLMGQVYGRYRWGIAKENITV